MTHRGLSRLAPAAMSAIIMLVPLPDVGRAQAAADPLGFFGPTVTLSASERQRLAKGDPLVKILPGDDREVAVFAAVRIAADADRLIAWARYIDQLKKAPLVLGIGRFSSPPRIEDLAGLPIPDDDLTAIRSCRPGHCDVKLTAQEIDGLKRDIAGVAADWKPPLRQAFRRVVLTRVQTYLTGGHRALASYADGHTMRPLHATFASIVHRSPYLTQKLPHFADSLVRHPDAALAGTESFVYWSTERFGGKPVTSATHVTIWRGDDSGTQPTLVAGKQVFATHYLNGSLNVLTILSGNGGSPNYLVTLNRSEVDVLGGAFGGLVRRVIERRVKSEAVAVLQGLRRRLEGGMPQG